MAKVIGITGGLGSGKTTLVNRLKSQGIPTVTADEVSRKITSKGSPTLRALQANFGPTVLTHDGNLDRQKLGQWVFRHPDGLYRLNQLTHPPMRRLIERTVQNLKAKGYPVITIEAAVFFEMNLQRIVDKIWSIIASERERLKRLDAKLQGYKRLDKIKLKRWEVWLRMNKQLPEQMFIRRANRVINNNGRL